MGQTASGRQPGSGSGRFGRGILTLVILLVFIIGLSLVLYPSVSNAWNTYRQQKLLTSYEETVSDMEENGTVDYESEWERARNYNEALLPSILPDSFTAAELSDEPDEEYMACLNLTGDGLMGSISIPKIGVEIPIYHTTSDEVLQQGVGHLEGSSLPAGGGSTHAVLAAHRGLPSAKLFTDLDQMEEGDHFFLYILDDVLAYEVDQILVVEPDETDALSVIEGEDLVTLLTCTPYGVNTQRLLVRGHRVDYEEAIADAETEMGGSSLLTNYILLTIAGLAVAAAVIAVIYSRYRRRSGKKKRRGKRQIGR